MKNGQLSFVLVMKYNSLWSWLSVMVSLGLMAWFVLMLGTAVIISYDVTTIILWVLGTAIGSWIAVCISRWDRRRQFRKRMRQP